MRPISFLFFVLILATQITAQVTQEWVKLYNSPGNLRDGGGYVASDAAGNIYVAGSSGTSSPSLNFDYTLIKYNPDGEVIWVRNYDFNNLDSRCNAMALDSEGNIYLTGGSKSTNTDRDIVTIKYDSSGAQLWVQRYNASIDDWEWGFKLSVDTNNNIYVGGMSGDSVVIIKYNSFGAQQWANLIDIGGGIIYGISDMTIDNIGNVYIAGLANVNNITVATVMKYNTNGNLQWTQNAFGTLESSQSRSIKVDNDGNVFVTGVYSNKYATAKFNSAGAEQWIQLYGSEAGASAYAIALDNAGNAYVTGTDNINLQTNGVDVTTVKYSSSGDQIWTRTYNGPDNRNEDFRINKIDNDGNIYVYGYTESATTSWDPVLIKYSSEGDTLWTQIYNGPWPEFTENIAIDENLNVYATGGTYDPANFDDFIWIIKYSQPQKPRYPVFIVPGVGATYSANTEYDLGWILKRGIEPDSLQIDPLARVYDDLIITLENLGYVKGKDLFIANYDWRLPPGPVDNNINGHIDGISGTSITSGQFKYGVDYLGWFIKQACDRWRQDHNEELDSIDIISHSTGGLVTRTYIQSDAYGGVYDNPNNYRLPKIRNFVMIGVPNRGASKPWNPIHDNWTGDIAYRVVLSKIVNSAYQKVLAGATITGPDQNINLASILDPLGNPDKELFINKYVPTIRYLLATYDFIDFGNGLTNVNNDVGQRNTMLLDLNNGFDINPLNDPNGFLDSAKVTVIYGTGETTKSWVNQRSDFETFALQSFTDFTPSTALPGSIWYKDIEFESNGDGTVPTNSSAGQFLIDTRANMIPFALGNHTGLVSQQNVQTSVLDILNVPYNLSNISTGHSTNYDAVLSVILDPVNLLITDGNGDRLGFTSSTGALTEIPNSVWFGNTDGRGWVFGSVQEPINLQLTGLGEDYYVMVSVEDSGKAGGVVLEGFLAEGEVINCQITLDPVSVEQINSVIPQDFTLAQNFPNPFNPVTTIQYSIPQQGNVSLKVYDVLGNEIAELVNEEKGIGVYSVNFDASNLASGIYLYKIRAGNFVETKKMILLK